MKKIKNIRHLQAEQQKLREKQVQLETKLDHQWHTLKRENSNWVSAASWGYSLLTGRLWKKAGKKWFDLFK